MVKHLTLGTRVSLTAGLLVAAGLLALSAALISNHRGQIVEEMIHGTDNVAQTLLLSISKEMLDDNSQGVQEVIEAVATHPGVERIRLFNKEGKISYSSRPDEIGNMVDKNAEACFLCHDANEPIHHLTISDRSRIYENEAGKKILSTITVIQNEKRCSGTDCHEDPTAKSVLGVLDVGVSLEPTEKRIFAASWHAAFVSLGVLVLTTVGLFIVVQNRVNRPLWNLIDATRQVASGDFSQKVSPTAAAEIGILTRSFNEMVESMHVSRTKEHKWINALKDEIEKKSKEVRAAQYQAMQAEKLSAVGLVAAGVAHELNSPLMAIITFGHLVRKKLVPDSQDYHDVGIILDEAKRCAVIIRNLLDFSRDQKLDQQLTFCSPGEIVNHTLELVRPKFRENEIEEECLIAEGLPQILVDQSQMTSVFLNLMLNAIQAMKPGGKLSLKLDEVRRKDFADRGLPPNGRSDALVRFRVRDTGHGISAEQIGRVFEPFFTTKPAGQGSGLGLSISYGIVTRHGGTILIDSDGASWTEFTVLLPVAKADAAIESASSTS